MKNMWSEFRMLAFVTVVAAVLVFAGCSSPTGSDAGAGTGTVTISGADIEALNTTHTIDRVIMIGKGGLAAFDTKQVNFCIEGPPIGPFNSVIWGKELDGTEPLKQGFSPSGYTPTLVADFSPESGNLGSLDGDRITKIGTFVSGNTPSGGSGAVNITFEFDVRGMLLEYDPTAEDEPPQNPPMCGAPPR